MRLQPLFTAPLGDLLAAIASQDTNVGDDDLFRNAEAEAERIARLRRLALPSVNIASPTTRLYADSVAIGVGWSGDPRLVQCRAGQVPALSIHGTLWGDNDRLDFMAPVPPGASEEQVAPIVARCTLALEAEVAAIREQVETFNAGLARRFLERMLARRAVVLARKRKKLAEELRLLDLKREELLTRQRELEGESTTPAVPPRRRPRQEVASA